MMTGKEIEMKKDIRILLVDGQDIVRQGLRHMLEPEDDMKIVGDYSFAEEALSQVEILWPNIVLTDMQMPGMDGIELTRRLKGNGLAYDGEVIVLAHSAERMVEALEAGAAGYVLKDTKRAELVQVIRQVYCNYSLTERDGASILLEEIELAIPSHTEAAQLLEFLGQVQQTLQADILQTVGSWNDGTAITIQLPRPTPLVDILDKLENMAYVEKVEGLVTKDRSYSFLEKFRKMLNPRTNPRKKTLSLTLKQASVTGQAELAGLRMSQGAGITLDGDGSRYSRWPAQPVLV